MRGESLRLVSGVQVNYSPDKPRIALQYFIYASAKHYRPETLAEVRATGIMPLL